VKALREALAAVNLSAFAVESEEKFCRALDARTDWLTKQLPQQAQSWGLARKCLNIFLRDCVYNHHLREHFEIAQCEAFLEVPLDRVVVEQLKARHKGPLPRWWGVKYVGPFESAVYQLAASEIANSRSIARVHLDAYFWGDGER